MLEGPNEGILSVGKMTADHDQYFSEFFINKIKTIRNDITYKCKTKKIRPTRESHGQRLMFNVNNVMLGSNADSSIDCLDDFAPETMSEIKKVM